MNARRYVELGWLRDKRVRDTGPYLGGKSYGTHPAVRVYYSPGVIRWLKGGRAGTIPDGEMIIKEQYAAPAIRHEGKSEEQLWESLESWTVMVKDASGSHDGWFWSNPVKGQCVVDNHAASVRPSGVRLRPLLHPLPRRDPVARRRAGLGRERIHLRLAAEHLRLPRRADPLPRR